MTTKRLSTRLIDWKPSAADLARAVSATRFTADWILTNYFALYRETFKKDVPENERHFAKEHSDAMLLAANIAEQQQHLKEPTFWEGEYD